MAAKDYSLPFKNEQNINIGGALNGQYTNLNLNQNHQNLSNAFVELPKTSTEKRKILNSDFLNHDDLQAKKLSHSWKKSTKMLPSNFENDDFGKEDDLKQRNNSIANNNSTLSLHISAYENSNEDSFDKKKDCLKQNDLNKFLKSASASVIQNPFEFPRQQYDNVLEPEMSKYIASQRLLNLNSASGNRLGSFRSTMAQKVRAAYDFDAQPGSGELSIRENEILTVIRENIEGGWIEGRNAKGQVGLFPESYVNKIQAMPSAPPPSNPPPPLPPTYAQPPPSNILPPLPAQFGAPPPSLHDEWADPRVPTTPVYPILPPPSSLPNPASAPSLAHQALAPTQSAAQLHDDDFDDDWSDEDEEVADATKDGDKLSASFVANGNRRRSRSQSRATSGSRTDLSTDDESTAISGHPSPSPGPENVTVAKEGTKSDEQTKEGPPSTRNNGSKEAQGGNAGAVSQQRQVSRSRSAGPDTISNSGKPGASRMKTINRFSNFVKSGMESYILTQSKMASEPGERHEVIIKDGRIIWAPPAQKYSCLVDKPKKESKLKGLKSFIAYSVTSSLTNIQVSRRYKHFDWLHEQLSNKYLLIPIPPLPEKQVSGRYEEDLIEHRKQILQLWVDKICRHPVLSQSEVWQHFITTTDEKKWKNGKRTAEKDEYVGGNFFNCVTVPSQHVESGTAERQIESFVKSVRSLDDSIKNLYACITETQKRLVGPYKANWQKMAAALDSLGQSFQLDHSSAPVKSAIAQSANVLHKIGAQHEEHGKTTTEQLMDFIYTYKGVLSGIPDVVNIHRSAFAKLSHNDKLMMDGKLSPQEADAIHRRVEVITYSMLAEINHISQEANDDFRLSLGTYFAKEADFYMNIGQQLGKLADQFKK